MGHRGGMIEYVISAGRRERRQRIWARGSRSNVTRQASERKFRIEPWYHPKQEVRRNGRCRGRVESVCEEGEANG
jgi:hypothetical protein